jgi:formate hydrogenlyase transcriptional activator
VYLKQEIAETVQQGEIIGNSPALKEVLRKVALVAPTDSTVLIHGETGTGKELIARALHEGSRRRDRPMIKLNCSAISAGLVESELFGHVKGAFTGALDRRVGRFELADGGTLFLDEVSELPLETQAKLLRVLQEQEFEPVGSSKSIKVDVRVIAATNRDLEADARDGRFRSDLFYRLNVFPIDLPPLRERQEDIPLLAEAFMQRIARKLGKRLKRMDPESLAKLRAHGWPGNIRDLQNTIERAAVLATSDVLTIDWDLGPRVPAARDTDRAVGLPQPAHTNGASAPSQIAPPWSTPDSLALDSIERNHIVEVLKRTRGVIEGPKGAARLLNLKPSTARFRMKKLGITKDEYAEAAPDRPLSTSR